MGHPRSFDPSTADLLIYTTLPCVYVYVYVYVYSASATIIINRGETYLELYSYTSRLF